MEKRWRNRRKTGGVAARGQRRRTSQKGENDQWCQVKIKPTKENLESALLHPATRRSPAVMCW